MKSVTYQYGISDAGGIHACGAIHVSPESVYHTDEDFASIIENEAMHLAAEMKAELRRYRKEVLGK